MVEQSARLLTASSSETGYMAFVFFASLASYSFHYFLSFHSVHPTPRLQWINRNRYVHAILFFAGITGAAWYGWPLMEHWKWLIPSVIATFLYSAPKIPHPLFRSLRKVAIGKTIFLAFIWMYVTTVLPVVVAGKEWNNADTLFVIGRFFFIYTICILFDYRDRDDDKADGVKSLITYLSDRHIRILFYSSFAIFVACTLPLFYYGFSWSVTGLLLLPGIIVALSYNKATRTFSDLYYYFFLDGMMAASALLMLVAGI